MIRQLLLILVIASAFCATGEAQLPKGVDAFKPKSNVADVSPPEPIDLQPNWWKYFGVDGEELQQRVTRVIQRLEDLPTELPNETREAAKPFIERIQANLQALPHVTAKPGPNPPAPVAYAEHYSLAQLLDIAKRLRAAQAGQETAEVDIATSSQAIKATTRRIDTLTAAYLTLDPSAPRRVIRALEIMAERSAVAVAKEQLRVQKAAAEANKVRIEHLISELDIATERLSAKPSEIPQLDREIRKTARLLTQAEENLVKAQARALDMVDAPTAADIETISRYRNQRVLAATVEVASITLRLISLQTERYLILLLLDKPYTQEQIRAHLLESQQKIVEIGEAANSWIADSERERNRAGEAVTEAARRPDTEPPMFGELINEDRVKLVQETLGELKQLNDELVQADLLAELLKNQLIRKEGWLSEWWARTQQVATHFWHETAGWATMSLFKIGDAPVTSLGLLRVVLILFIAWSISYWLRRVLTRLGERRVGFGQSSFYTIGRLSHYVIIIIGFMIGLSSIGINFTNFALVAGALSVGIGFGLQSIVNNFVSGLIILFERSLKVGDFVELKSGVAGEVVEINVRSTMINTNDNVDIVVPNSEFINADVINWTLREDYRRIHVPFGVAYDSDKHLVAKAVLDEAAKVPHTLTDKPGRTPSVWLIDFGDNRMIFELVVWVTPRAVKRPNAVHAAYMWAIEGALRKNGIQVPFPQRDLHLRSGFSELLRAEVSRN